MVTCDAKLFFIFGAKEHLSMCTYKSPNTSTSVLILPGLLKYPSVRPSTCTRNNSTCKSKLHSVRLLVGPRHEKACPRGFRQARFKTVSSATETS